MAAQTVILVEIDVTSPAGVASVLRLSDRAISPMAPTDPLRPNAVWDDRLKEAPSLRRALFDDLASLTPALGVGAMTLTNADGGLDGYQGHVWKEIRVYRWTEGALFSAATPLFRGLVGTTRYSHSTSAARGVQVALYDYRAELDRPVQATVFAGTNGGAVYYEGAVDGLKGRPKPLAYGMLTNAHLPAPQVNGALLAYQLHDGAVSGSIQIFDRGQAAGFTDQGDRSGATFDGYTPPAASSTTDKGRGLLKINGDPVGKLTFGCLGDSTGGYVESAGPIIARLLARASVPGGRIGASIAALSSTAPVGIFASEQINTSALIAILARSAGAAVTPDRLGVWQAMPLTAPAGVASFEIAADQVVSLSADDSAPDPAGVIRVGWGKIYTTFEANELLPALVKTTTAERLAEPFRWAVAEDATVKARLPGTWRTLELETALRVEADAVALAAKLKALFALRADGKPRRQWKVVIEMTDAVLGVALGATVRLIYPPLGIDEMFVLLAEEPMRPRRDFITWTLWG